MTEIRGRGRKKLLDDLKEIRGNRQLKEEALEIALEKRSCLLFSNNFIFTANEE